jgi:hypothetical protein
MRRRFLRHSASEGLRCGRSEARPRPRPSALPPTRCARAHVGRCSARAVSLFTMSNSAVFFIPVARSCARVSLFLFRPPSPKLRRDMSVLTLAAASPPRIEGRAERREAVSSFRRALVKARTTFARRGRPGANRDGPLGAPTLAVLGPLRALRLRSWPAAPLRGRPSLPGVAPGRPKVPNLPGTVYEPRPGRHSSLRLQDRLRRRPSMSEDASHLARVHLVVNSVVVT